MKKTTTAWLRVRKGNIKRRVLIVASELFEEYVAYGKAGWIVDGWKAR